MDGGEFDVMPLGRLEAVLTETAGHLAAAECRFLLAIAAFDRREGWKASGCRSCAYWLSWRCGLGLRTAQEKLRVAHGLTLFGQVRAEFAIGRLSYSKVRALTRMAGPRTEHDLVEMALRATAAHMESIARGYRRVERSAERAQPTADRGLGRRVQFCELDGDTVMIARLTAEETELVRSALDNAGEQVSKADALVMMAESFLANGHGCRKGSDRTLLLVHTDEGVLAGDDSNWPRLEDGPVILPETVRRLACDASFAWLLRGMNGEPTNISAKFAALPRSMRRLVRARDQGGCRFPGCAESRYTDIHHLVHRANGGANELSNLATLCWFHHRLVHEGGWTLERTPSGEFVATNPGGATLTAVSPVLDGRDGSIQQYNAEHGIDITPTTAIPLWGGERVDLGWAVTSLWYSNHPETLAAERAA